MTCIASTTLEFSVKILCAHVGANTVETQALPGLIREIFQTLSDLQVNGGAGAKASESAEPVPAVSPKKSVFAEYIICLEDGKKLKMLKRHLMSAYGLTPKAYRERWALPESYPMVAPNYAERRSALAKKAGLGRKSETSAGAPKASKKRL